MLYTLETLKAANPVYHSVHRIEQFDVNITNKYAAIIREGRTDNHIQAGDIVELTTRYGDYYGNAHIEKYDPNTDTWYVCERGTPFVFKNKDGEISCLTSGGGWCYVPNNLTLLGTRMKFFWYFGSCGPCADGGINFEAEVNVWEYKQPDPLYGNYTTKDWRRRYISYCVDQKGNPHDRDGYRYLSNGFALRDKEDYEAWLKTFRGVEFKNNSPNQTVVFYYREREHLIEKSAWEKLDLRLDTRLCNGINLCKVSYDDSAHIIDVYRFDNAGTLDQRRFKPYELARGWRYGVGL